MKVSRDMLYNGNCSDVMKQLPDNYIDCIITDVPYGVNYKNTFYNDDKDYVLNEAPKWFEQYYRIIKNDSYLYMFVGVKTLHNWIQLGIDAGFTYKNVIATRSFNNGSPTPKNNFGFQFQPIILFSKGKGKAFNDVEFIPTSVEWLNDKRNKNPKPYTYSYPNWIKTDWAFATAKRANKSMHPNEKNIDLIEFFVKVSTNEGDVVLDSFMGCGSTGIACVNSNRSFVGIELDETYFKLAKERISNERTSKEWF